MSLLTYIIGLPFLAAAAVLFLPRSASWTARAISVTATGLVLGLSLLVFLTFPLAPRGPAGFRFFQKVPWVEQVGIQYEVGVDGINVGLVLMSAIVAFAASCACWNIREREKEFHFLLLVMAGGVLGAFASLDIFFFYFFHELALVPTFIMIGIWGQGENKNYATFQITIYLTLGALVALLGLVALYLQSGSGTFDMVALAQHVREHPIPVRSQEVIFGILLLGFGVLLSLWPFHTWAPAGYAAAPAPTAMLHAGALKSFGLYGLIRLAIPILPHGAQTWMPILAWLCLGNILYTGWVAMRQKDFNLLIGHSSVAHMGFVLLGIASLSVVGVTGAVMVMVAHGLLAALSFAVSGYLYHQRKSTEMRQFGGLLATMPFVGAMLIIAMLATCGLPGFANFAGEILVLFGAWNSLSGFVVAVAWGGLIIGAVYALRAIRKMAHGPEADCAAPGRDARGAWDRLPFSILVAALLVFGFFPRWITDRAKQSVAALLSPSPERVFGEEAVHEDSGSGSQDGKTGQDRLTATH